MSCLVRKVPVALTPEEKVRQALLHMMISEKGYPIGALGVEVHLPSLPHFKGKKTPLRRADIIVFTPSEFAMRPLLLIECKAVPLNAQVIRQVIGYNYFVQAPYIVIANGDSLKTGHYKKEGWVFQEGLPTYQEILSSLK